MLFIQPKEAQKRRKEPKQHREVRAADGENMADAESAKIALNGCGKAVLVPDEQRFQHGGGVGFKDAVNSCGDCAADAGEERQRLLACNAVFRDGADNQHAVRKAVAPFIVAV